MKLKIDSAIRTNYWGFNSIARVAEESRDHWWGHADFDFSSCDFFEANMAASLYSVVGRLQERLNYVTFTGLANEIDIILRKNLFLAQFGKEAVHDDKNTTIPFRLFGGDEKQEFVDYIEAPDEGKGRSSNVGSGHKRLSKAARRSFHECGRALFLQVWNFRMWPILPQNESPRFHYC